MATNETALQKYGEVNMGAAIERRKKLQQELAEKRSRAGFLKTPEGKTMVRMAPPWKVDAELPIKEVWLHKMKDPNDLQAPPKMSVPCVAKNHGKSCLICKRCKELRATGAQTDKDLAFHWGAQQRYFAQVVNLEKLDDGWVLWEFGPKIFDDLLDILGTEDKGGDVTHPVTGRNLLIDRTGTGVKDTKYKVSASIKASKFPVPALLTKILDLDTLADPMANDKMEAALKGERLDDDSAEKPVGNVQNDLDATDAEFTETGIE